MCRNRRQCRERTARNLNRRNIVLADTDGWKKSSYFMHSMHPPTRNIFVVLTTSVFFRRLRLSRRLHGYLRYFCIVVYATGMQMVVAIILCNGGYRGYYLIVQKTIKQPFSVFLIPNDLPSRNEKEAPATRVVKGSTSSEVYTRGRLRSVLHAPTTPSH